jgi:hypothetical protein
MVGKTVYWGNLKGEIKIEQIDSILVSFESIGDYYFHKDGRLYKNLPPILSFVPYEIPKFEQPIEKDAFVWCKNSDNECWSARYYSHMEGGVHYCFLDQLKSHQTNNPPRPWIIVQTESPFTHD